MKDQERIDRIQSALRKAELDAVVCSLSSHVLLLSGYWPVVSLSVAIATREGRVVVFAPEDESGFTQQGWADEVHFFQPVSLDQLRSTKDVIFGLMRDAAAFLPGVRRIGVEAGPDSIPASYAAMNFYGASLPSALQEAIPAAVLQPADVLITELASVKTPYEVNKIRHACDIAGAAYGAGARQLCVGIKETAASSLFRRHFGVFAANDQTQRGDGHTFCMSGKNSAQAYGAFAHSREKEIADGDLVLVHANSFADGYWTDVTRTYTMGGPSVRQRKIYEAIFEARKAAMDCIRPGIKAHEVDAAARDVLKARGFTKEFKHPTGHGVGFSAISPNAHPQIHPQSNEALETGMVFNVEPAIYIEGYGAARHCDMVAVTPTGADLLTPFQSNLDQLICETK